MKIKDFKAGAWRKGYQYQYFLPEHINHNFSLDDSKTQEMLEMAAFRLGELNSFAKLVPDIDIFIQSYVMKDAVKSSRIEGTRTNIEEAFSDELDIEPENRDDWREVKHYVNAMNYALGELKKLPLSNRLICNTHKVLLSHSRGKNKNPGSFRKSQNWIGGADIKSAAFVPPSQEHVPELMSDLEKFFHNYDINVPYLVKIAIAHYQFETIHPFLDGNGRMGRLLTTLYLVSHKVLDKPLLYTSDFFECNKTLYYDKLTFVREKNDLLGWIQFFLIAIEKTAESAVITLQDILKLKEDVVLNKVPTLGKKINNATILARLLFSRPVISVGIIEKEVNLSTKAANDLARDFMRLGILKETTGYKRNRIFVFDDYLQTLMKEKGKAGLYR